MNRSKYIEHMIREIRDLNKNDNIKKLESEFSNLINSISDNDVDNMQIINIFTKIMNLKPLTPIIDQPDEFNEPINLFDDTNNKIYEHRRCKDVFYTTNDNRIRYKYAIKFQDILDENNWFFSNMFYRMSSCAYIKNFPFLPKTITMYFKNREIIDIEAQKLKIAKYYEIKTTGGL